MFWLVHVREHGAPDHLAGVIVAIDLNAGPLADDVGGAVEGESVGPGVGHARGGGPVVAALAPEGDGGGRGLEGGRAVPAVARGDGLVVVGFPTLVVC